VEIKTAGAPPVALNAISSELEVRIRKRFPNPSGSFLLNVHLRALAGFTIVFGASGAGKRLHRKSSGRPGNQQKMSREKKREEIVQALSDRGLVACRRTAEHNACTTTRPDRSRRQYHHS